MTKTLCELSVNCRSLRARDAMALMLLVERGIRVATRLVSSKKRLLSRSSSSFSRHAGSGRLAVPSGTRLLRLVRARSVCGNQ